MPCHAVPCRFTGCKAPEPAGLCSMAGDISGFQARLDRVIVLVVSPRLLGFQAPAVQVKEPLKLNLSAPEGLRLRKGRCERRTRCCSYPVSSFLLRWSGGEGKPRCVGGLVSTPQGGFASRGPDVAATQAGLRGELTIGAPGPAAMNWISQFCPS
jgi:hypothetical protein